jgi:hypothetical protein
VFTLFTILTSWWRQWCVLHDFVSQQNILFMKFHYYLSWHFLYYWQQQMAKAGKYSDLFSVINFTWTPDFHFQMRLNVKIWISSPVTQSAISCVTVTVKDYPHCALVHPEALLYYDVKRDINWCLFNKTRKSSDCIISVKCLYLTFI